MAAYSIATLVSLGLGQIDFVALGEHVQTAGLGLFIEC
jgi:hypothetical protein